MDPAFACRANIERFEQLLTSGSLSAAQIAVVTALLGKEVEALALQTKRSPSNPVSPIRLSD